MKAAQEELQHRLKKAHSEDEKRNGEGKDEAEETRGGDKKRNGKGRDEEVETRGGDNIKQFAEKQMEIELELCQAQLTCNELREEVGKLKDECARLREVRGEGGGGSKGDWKEECARWKAECMRVQKELTEAKKKWKEKRAKLQGELWREQEESGKLREELSEEKSRYNAVNAKYRSLKEENKGLKKSKKGGDAGERKGKEDSAKLRKDYEILEEEFRLLQEECNAWKIKQAEWKGKYNALKEEHISLHEECDELRAEHKDDIRTIAKLRRDNELLWEQVDARGGERGGEVGRGGSSPMRANDSLKGSVHLIPQHTDSLKVGELGDAIKEGEKGEKEGERDEGDGETLGSNRTRITLATVEEDIHNNTATSHNSTAEPPRSAPSTQERPRPLSGTGSGIVNHHVPPTHDTPTTPHPTLYPDEADGAMDTQSIMYEAQELAHQHATATLLAQMEKLSTQLQALVRTTRSSNQQQWSHHQAHVAHLHAQVSHERDASLYVREVYEQDTQRLQEASLDALRSHLHGIKSVYHALSY